MIRHCYDERMRHDVLDVGERTYPVKRWICEDRHDHAIRQALLEFENRWCLSIIWGSANYGDNYHYPWGYEDGKRTHHPFVEEPHTVEVGVLSPVPRILKGMDPETAEYFFDQYPTDAKTVAWMVQDKPTDLACDPFGYLDADAVNRLADEVMKLPSHPTAAEVEAIGERLAELPIP